MQKRGIEYNSPDSSYQMNKLLLAGVPAGLYAGFDAALGGSMTLTLHHDTTGYEEVNIAGTLLSKQGVVVSRQGVRVYESDAIALPINPTTVSGRRDAIVMEHSYTEVTGGQSATFSVLEGAGETPTLTPNQVLLGVLTLPANCTALNQIGVSYASYRKLNLSELLDLAHTKYDISQDNVFVVPDVDYSPGWTYTSINSKFRVLKTQSGQIYFAGRVKATAGMTNVLLTVDDESYLSPFRSVFVAYVLRPVPATTNYNTIPIVVDFAGTNSKTLLIQEGTYTPQADDIITFDGITFPFF